MDVAPTRARMRAFLVALIFTAACGGEGGLCEALVEAQAPSESASHAAQVFYLNRTGATVAGGPDRASSSVSSIVGESGRDAITIPPAALDEATWAEVVACVRSEFSRFDVEIVDERPTQPGYTMVLFGGTGDELGLGEDVRGKAPMRCETTPDAVVFVFSDKLGAAATPHCNVAAHELAHVFSVDHELLAADALSYLPFGGVRSFQDVDAPCGEDTARACTCGGSSQNSVRILTERLGAARHADASPPAIAATAKTARPGYASITVQASASRGIASVALSYQDAGTFIATTCGDGQVPCIVDGTSYTFTIAGARGTARYNAVATDFAGNVTATPSSALTIDDSPPESMPATIEVETHGTSARIVAADATATAATLYFTDTRGVTTSRALCRTESGRWALDVELAARQGQRSFIVGTTYAGGLSRYSSRTTLP